MSTQWMREPAGAGFTKPIAAMINPHSIHFSTISPSVTPGVSSTHSTSAADHDTPVGPQGLIRPSAMRKRDLGDAGANAAQRAQHRVRWRDEVVAAQTLDDALEDCDWTVIDHLNRSTVDFIAGVLAQQPDRPFEALNTAMHHFYPAVQFAHHTDRNGALVRVQGATVSVLSLFLNHACRTHSSARLVESAIVAEAVIALLTSLHIEGRCHVQAIEQLSPDAQSRFIASRLRALQTLQQGQHLPGPDVFSPISLENIVTQAQAEPVQARLVDGGGL